MFSQSSFHKIFYLFALLVFFCGPLAFAASSSSIDVSAELSRNRVPAGDVVQLDVKVTGIDRADLPADISVDGLQIRLAGQSSEVQMVNFSVTSSILYSYIVIPLRSGTFTIPSIKIRAQGKYFSTSPLQLTVVGGAPSGVSAQVANQPTPNSVTTFSAPVNQRSSSRAPKIQVSFAEVTLPKKELYVGEVMPVEIRFYFDVHYQVKPLGGLNFGGEGLLVDRFTEPEIGRSERNGFLYNVVTFRSLISAVKPGPIDIAPATLDALVQIPGEAPPGMDPALLMQLFGNQGAGSIQQQKITIKSNKLSLDIKPLPVAGKPADFVGAIGDFHLAASVNPTKVTTGDPITLSFKLEGKGNFKAIGSPQLTEEQAWKTYPSSDHFEATDAVGWKGTKTFETTMIALQPQSTTPGSSFSYFDPTSEKYVTLTTKPLPITMVAATNSSLSNSNVATVAAQDSTPKVTPAIPKNEQGDHSSPHYWKDPFHRRPFVVAWFVLFGVTLLLALYLAIRRYQRADGSPHKRHRLQLQSLWSQLQHPELDALAFTTAAVAYGEGIVSDALFKKNVPASDQEVIRKELHSMITRLNEINYGARELLLSDGERAKTLQRLAHWRQLLEKK